MFSFRTVSAVSILGLLVTIAGCSGAAESNSGADTTGTVRAQDSVAAQGGRRFGKGGPRHGGPRGGGDMLVGAALHEPSVNLTADQKTTLVAALKADRPAKPDFDSAAAKTRSTALAAGIRSGNIDASLVTPPKPDFAAMQANKVKLLTTLHDTLTADQRQALVTAIQTRAAEHDGDRKGPGGEKGAKGGPRGEGGPMGGLLKDLNLTQAQKDQIKTKLEANRPAKPTDAQIAQRKAQHEAMKTQRDAKLQSFVGASFDANAFVAPPAGAKPPQMGERGDHFAKELQAIVSVLDGTQREALAKKIEAGPPARPAPPAQQ